MTVKGFWNFIRMSSWPFLLTRATREREIFFVSYNLLEHTSVGFINIDSPHLVENHCQALLLWKSTSSVWPVFELVYNKNFAAMS